MVLPVSMLIIGALLLYAGMHDMSVTDALGTLLGRRPQGGLGTIFPGGSSNSDKATATQALMTGSDKVPGHPELKPAVSRVVNTVLAQFPHLVITSTLRPSEKGSYHAVGRACDISGFGMKQAAQWISANLTPSLVEGIHNPGLSVKNGQPVPSSFWGAATWLEHMNHIHLAA